MCTLLLTNPLYHMRLLMGKNSHDADVESFLFGEDRLDSEGAFAPWADESPLDTLQDRRLGGSSSGLGGSHNATQSSAHGAHGHHKSAAFDPVLFFLVVLFVSCFSQQIVNVLPHQVRPPHSVVLYTIGMLMEWYAYKNSSELAVAIHGFSDVDPHVLFWVLLPLLLYEDAASSDWHVITRVLTSSIILAIPGVIINTLLTGGLIKLIDIMDFKPALLLGSILSATDPVAVVGALAALQAPLKLSSIIKGESLLNDGSAVVLFQIFLEVAAGRKEFEFGSALEKLCRLAGGGVAFGLALALAAHIWLAKTRNFSVERHLIILCVFGSFYLAEHTEFGFSGVLATVTFGFFMASLGKYDLTIGKEHEHHTIIECLAFFCNEAIFIIAGVVGYKFTFLMGIEAKDWGHLGLLYIGVHVTRSIVMWICFPILHFIGYRLSLKEAIICVFGGLRGAVGLALGLLVLGDRDMDTTLKAKIAFHTNGIVIGTLFINGLLITPLYKALQIQSKHRSANRKALLTCLCIHGDDLVTDRCDILKKQWFFRNCHRDIVDSLVPTLEKEMEHCEEDFYGRRLHRLADKSRITRELDALAAKLGENGVDMEELKRLATQVDAKSYHNLNIFQNSNISKFHESKLNVKKLGEKVRKVEREKSALIGSDEHSKMSAEPSEAAKPSYPPAEGPAVSFQKTGESGQAIEFQLTEESVKKIAADENAQEVLADIPSERLEYLKYHPSFQTWNSSAEATASGLVTELQESLLNARKAAYFQMFESDSLSRSAYFILMASVDYQTEAVHGDLKNYSFLRQDLPDIWNRRESPCSPLPLQVVPKYLESLQKS
jgi:NhaP-type Na+/H+ or K+/H+ antiporter